MEALDPDGFASVLSETYYLRLEEINHLKNLARDEKARSTKSKEEHETILLKTLYLVLYAHFEGFCKFCFQSYVEELNKLNLKVKDVKEVFACVNLDDLFGRLYNANIKCPELKDDFPNDSGLHRIYRQSEFLKSSRNFLENILELDPNSIVDMESNVKPEVLRRLFFKLGLSLSKYKLDDGTLHKLLNLRNKVAHEGYVGAEDLKFLTVDEFGKMEAKLKQFMESLIQIMSSALKDEEFLKSKAP